MSSQAIHDIALAMRRAVKRSVEGSDTEEPIDMVSNRGNKLKKRAKFVHEGHLAPSNSYKVYEENVTYGDGAYTRSIISRIPKLYDEDGYEVDENDDDERKEAAMAEAAENYPYADIRIEELLAPLTAASDLPIHPTLSTPFKSEILTQLTQNACEMTRKERTSLWKMKHLLTRLGGDHTWVPTGMLETEGDLELFREDKTLYQNNLLLPGSDEVDEGETSTVLSVDAPDIPAIEVGEHEDENNEEAQENSSAKENRLGDAHKSIALGVEDNTDDVAMIDASEDVKPTDSTVLNQEPVTADSLDVNSNEGEFGAIKAESEPDPDETLVDESTILEDDQDTGTSAQGVVATNGHNNGQDANLEEADEAVQDGDDAPEPRRMRTRAQAQAASDESPSNTRSASPDSEPLIDPYFLAPPNSIPDRNVGIPVNEADEVRRILQLYIQKQEEVCRGAEKVYNGLLKAERLRKTVLKWAKAEGHVGEMSDGEDWYDMEEWNLSEELKKGQDEEEEDAATTAKKTRTRRQ